MNSKRFGELRKRVNQLNKNLLPVKFEKTGNYSPRVLDRVRGYCLLIHAEIEAYFEDVATKIITEVLSQWRLNRKPTNQLISFLSYFKSSWHEEDVETWRGLVRQVVRSQSRSTPVSRVDDVIMLAQTQYSNIISGNNGIKEDNLRKIFHPLDLDCSATPWLADINSLAVQRGALAHTASSSAQTQLNPEDEYQKVARIISGLEKSDEDFYAVLQSIDQSVRF